MSSIKTPTRHHPALVTLHWLVFILIFALSVSGTYAAGLANDDPAKRSILILHLPFGSTTFFLLIASLVVHLRTPRPAYASTGNSILDTIGKITHVALFVLALLTSMSGMFLSIRSGLMPTIFLNASAALPADFFIFIERIFHGYVSKALFFLVLLHIGAALYHQVWLKDNLFSRMGYGKNS